MSSTVLAAILVMTISLMVVAAFGHLRLARQCYYLGIAFWSRWLPVTATGVYLAVLAVNLAPGSDLSAHPLGLQSTFSTTEIIVLFLVGPLFLTRIGNLLAIATVAYCIERLLAGSQGATPQLSLILITSSSTIVAILGDKMPWLMADGVQVLAYKLREILLIATTIGALAVVAAGIFKIHGFDDWVSHYFHISVSRAALLSALVVLFVGWLSVALGMTRHVTLPLLGLPSIFVLAYVSGWSSSLLVIPFAICMALSLATLDRRMRNRRRATGYAATVAYLR